MCRHVIFDGSKGKDEVWEQICSRNGVFCVVIYWTGPNSHLSRRACIFIDLQNYENETFPRIHLEELHWN